MKIILNFLPLKTGGGVQVALDFLENIRMTDRGHDWYLICRENTPFLRYLGGTLHLASEVSDNNLSRLRFEYREIRYLEERIKPDIIYTLFGPPLPRVKTLQVAGCAYSNLFYPEIDFWGGYPFFSRTLKKVKDRFRLSRFLLADIKIFENREIADRAIAQHKLPKSSVHYVPPTASRLVSFSGGHAETRERCSSLPDGFRVLLLSGYHRNKNIDFLVKVAKVIEAIAPLDTTVFVLTLPPDDSNVIRLMDEVDRYALGHRIFNLGPVPMEGCSELYQKVNATVLPSQLESFSNTIAESWIMHIPLLVSDLGWARKTCGRGAVYYEYLDANSFFSKLKRLKDDPGYYEQLVECGGIELRKLPSSGERYCMILKILESI